MLPGIFDNNLEDLSEKEIDQIKFFIEAVEEEGPGEWKLVGGPDYFLPADVVECPTVTPHNWVKRYDVTFDAEYNLK